MRLSGGTKMKGPRTTRANWKLSTGLRVLLEDDRLEEHDLCYEFHAQSVTLGD